MIAESLIVRGAFARAAERYDSVASYQRETAVRLLAELPPGFTPATIFDAGCGTGHGLQLMAERWPAASLVGADFALPMLLRIAPGNAVRRVCADAESLPLTDGQFDLYWSNLALQWCDTARFMREACRVLRDGGLFAATTLGPATFAELNRSFSDVDHYRHTNEFVDAERLQQLLAVSGLTLTSFRRIEARRHFADLRTLLASVRELGASRVSSTRRRPGLMGKSAWQRFVTNYERQRTGQGLPLTYDTFFITARK